MLTDLRHAIRLWLRRPALALLSIGVLALAIGSATAAFALVDSVLFRALPVAEPERLVRIFPRDEKNAMLGNSSAPDYAAYRDSLGSFAGIASYSGWTLAHAATPGGLSARVG